MVSPQGHFPWLELVCGWVSPWGSYFDCRIHPGNCHQGTLKNKPYYSYLGGYMAQKGWEESWGGGGRERNAMVSAFIVVRSGLPRFTLYWWIKNIRAENNVQEGKSSVNQAVSYLYHLGVSEGKFYDWGSLVVDLIVWLKMYFLEVNVLKWTISIIKSWCQVFALQSQKLIIRHFHCNVNVGACDFDLVGRGISIYNSRQKNSVSLISCIKFP